MVCRPDRVLALSYQFDFKNVLSGRFFVFVSLFICIATVYFPTYLYAVQTSDCVSPHFDERVEVKYVIDGDTVLLGDDRRVRLIGINTPEINHDKQSLSEAGALQAKNSLIALLQQQRSVQIVYDKQRFDRYGRTLAHLYLHQGDNIQALLLQQGLAMPLRISPNFAAVDCYRMAALAARKQQRGLWALPRYRARSVRDLTGTERGFYIIAGLVKRISESRSLIWINLQGDVALRLQKDDLSYFNKAELMALAGQRVEASGWLYKRNKQLRMRIRHKFDLKKLTD